MRRHLDEELQYMKQRVLTMGGAVEASIEEAMQALILRTPQRFEAVFSLEAQINQLHAEIDASCIRTLACQSPRAGDLRKILALIKMNSDLERMGDQAVNIAENGERYLREEPLKPLHDIPKISTQVQAMIRLALDAFVKNDAQLAEEVLRRDLEVDRLTHQVFQDLKQIMRENPSGVERSVSLLLIARNLERLGDHATNIAEDVVFAILGKDIRRGMSTGGGKNDVI